MKLGLSNLSKITVGGRARTQSQVFFSDCSLNKKMISLSIRWPLATMLFLPSSLLILLTVSTPSWCQSSDTMSPKASNGTPFPWEKMRLPEHIIPVYYDLLIHANLTTLTFEGTTEIEITASKPTSTIILHSHLLQISKATLKRRVGERLSAEPLRVLEYPPHEQIALLAPEPLAVGIPYTLVIDYTGHLSEHLNGFYKSTYRTKEGEMRVLASTHFEPTAARMAFPCFDEPAFKANFSVKIRREPRHLAISNMPLVESVTVAEGLIEDHFDVTVKMSTYLVAFIISDFESISKMTKSGVKVSIYAVPDKIHQADYALDTAVTLLEFYEDYFSIPYALPKQDLAAIPDFESGAMENWGLTTYRESSLLFDVEKSSAEDKLGITMIVSHELAHQWFGNLVTMEWWDDLWLNEGFAKFMEFVSVSVTHPELKVDDYFFGKCFNVMEVDALNSSHPVSTAVEDPAQIREMFDDVSYEKVKMDDKGLSPQAFLLRLLRDLIDSQTWTDEGSVSQRMLRSQLLLLACVRKYQPCVQRAEAYFREWKEADGNLSLPNDVTLAVFAVGVQNPEGWDFLYRKYQSSLSTSEKKKIEFALSISQDEDKLQWLLDEGFKGDVIKIQEFPHILGAVGRNPVGYRLAWQFLRENWDKLIEKFELGSSSLTYMVIGTTSQFSTRARLEEVKEFFSSLKEKGSQLRCVQQTIETIGENIRWMDKNFEKIRVWLQSEKLELL
nr:endoplasmic reticulum aminopeptidase 1 [Mirounga angustirostris]